MAARLKRSHQDDIRAKIQADRLIAWLHAGIFDELFQGKKVELIAVKVSAVNCLLNKSIPDLTRAELSGPDGGPFEFAEVIRRVVK